jgi:hypothetical protein
MLVNDDTSNSFEFPNVLDASAEGQVAIVFPLVALLYATFNIPVPQRGVPLWSMMTYPTEARRRSSELRHTPQERLDEAARGLRTRA